jgi:DmsE family decaheme c-type cytochrome
VLDLVFPVARLIFLLNRWGHVLPLLLLVGATVFIALAESDSAEAMVGQRSERAVNRSVAPQQTIQGDYVGPESCRTCHPDKFRQFSETAHAVTLAGAKWSQPDKGCEMCHGPGRKHVEVGGGRVGIVSPKRLSAPEVRPICLRCHEDQSQQLKFRHNEHDYDVLACNDCHSPHQPKKQEFMLIASQPELCYRCHREIRKEFSKPFHHKVPEAAMQCRDCHEQHGSFNTAQTRETLGGIDSLCLKCHSDKQGPFVFEHAPVKLEGCLVCHVPHGSVNNRMLIRSEVRLLCLECHADRQGAQADAPSGVHDLTSPRYQNCTSCHVMIHGSNASRIFFQ